MAGLLLGCPADQTAAPAVYELRCDAVYTAQVGEVVCVRHDTRTGETVRLNLEKLPMASTPAEPNAKQAGVYTLECTSTHADDKSDVYCVRMQRYTGELSVVTLPRLTVFPEPFAPRADPAPQRRQAMQQMMQNMPAGGMAMPEPLPPPGAAPSELAPQAPRAPAQKPVVDPSLANGR